MNCGCIRRSAAHHHRPLHPTIPRHTHVAVVSRGAHGRQSEIGSSIVVKGQSSRRRICRSAAASKESISVEGHALTVNPGAHLAADVEARAIDVQGSVSGVLCASELISLGTSAQVTGEVSAPSLRIVEGAVGQGKCETTGTKRKSSLQLAS